MAWLNRGFCGIGLKTHAYAIAVVDILLAITAMVVGFMLIINPEEFVEENEELMENETQLKIGTVEDSMTVEKVGAGEIAVTEQYHYNERINYMKSEGVEVVACAMITIVFAALMVVGVKGSKSTFLLPWMVESVVGIAVTVGAECMRLFSGSTVYVFEALLILLVAIPWYSYMVFGVASLYVLLRRMKKHTAEIISSVTEGQNGNHHEISYDRLHEELGKEMQALPNQNSTQTISDKRDDVPYYSI